MRTMEIPCFTQKISFVDLENLYKTRLRQKLDVHSSAAIPLLGYMAWPNDAIARQNGFKILKSWLNGENQTPDFKLIHQHWAHVADIVNLHHALSEGRHQESRGGASAGKAIFLASKRIGARGAKQPSLWRHWAEYKDVSHLIAAAILVCYDMQTRNRQKPFVSGFQDLLPMRIVCFLPDLVIGVGLTYEKYGLNGAAEDGKEPMLDPETVWRIPPEINIEPVILPPRPILSDEIVVLNARRAGNRGRANRIKTTLISA
jgi:hypothetical protein